MTPTQLRAFAAIARHGSAREAAEELGVSDAAISSHTAALRRELGDPLYERSAGGLAFTPGGLRLATRAVELLGLQDQTRKEVSAAGNGQRVLRLATTSLFAEYAAPGLLDLFKTRADDLEVEMSVHASDRFADMLVSRQADVTIAPRRRSTDHHFTSRDILKYQLILVVGTHHRLRAGRCHPDSLRSQTWLLGPAALEEHGATADLLSRFAVPEQHQRIFQSHGAAISAVQGGAGIGIVPEFRAREQITNGTLCRVASVGAEASGVWTATTLRSDQTPAVVAELMRFITTPRATQAMLSGSGTNIAHFRPKVHVTLWR